MDFLDIVECLFNFFAHCCIGLSVLFFLISKYFLIHSGYESFIRCIHVCAQAYVCVYAAGIFQKIGCKIPCLNLFKCICLSVYYPVVKVLHPSF